MPQPSPNARPTFIVNPDIDSRLALDAANRLAMTPPADLAEARDRIVAKIEGAISALTSVRAAIGDPAAK
jgi:hypothetical protein